MKSRRTKKTLISSMVSLVLCLAMLVGSTLAWFSDTINVTADLNFGSIKVALQKYIDDEYKNVGTKDGDAGYTESAEPVFDGINWAPSQTEVYYLAVSNEGKIAFNYDMKIVLEGDMAGALEYAIIDGLQAGTEDAEDMDLAVANKKWDQIAAAAGGQSGLVEEGELEAAPNGHLEVGAVDYFALVLHMDENAGNEYQGTSFNADIVVNARQVSYVASEEDGEEDGETGPFANYTTTKIYDFEDGFTLSADNGVRPINGNKGGTVTKETEADGNNYLNIKCLDDPKKEGFPGAFRADFLNLNEGVTEEEVVVYSFDMKLINEESYLYVNVPGGLKLQDGALWFEKSFEVDREDTANQVKLVDLVPGQWHHIDAEANFTTGEVYFYADGVKNPTPATRSNLTAPNSEIKFIVTYYNFPATSDTTADINVGIDNFAVKVPPVVDPFADYTTTKAYDFENDFTLSTDNGVRPINGNKGGTVTKETEADGNNYLNIKCLDDPKKEGFPGAFRADFLNLNEGVTEEEVVVYSFDMKLINEESYLYVNVPGGLKLQDGALWFEKSFEVDREDTANQVKLVDLVPGQWYHIDAEANFTTGEVYFYADGVKNPTPATRSNLTAPNSEIRFIVTYYNFPATSDTTADINVGVDNFEVKIPSSGTPGDTPVGPPSGEVEENPFEDYKVTAEYDFENGITLGLYNATTGVSQYSPNQATTDAQFVKAGDDGNHYVYMRRVQAKEPAKMPLPSRVQFNGIFTPEVIASDVVVYTFDIMQDVADSFMSLGVENIKLTNDKVWVCLGEDDEAEVLVDMSDGEWHNIAVKVDYANNKTYFYGDWRLSEKVADAASPLKEDYNYYRFRSDADNWPALDNEDKTNNFGVGIDNFKVMIPN